MSNDVRQSSIERICILVANGWIARLNNAEWLAICSKAVFKFICERR